jgi:AcrR family transcriptional regulator
MSSAFATLVVVSSEAHPVDRPLRRDAQRNRQRILEAARALFAERGLDVTLDQVAARAGVGVGTVYRRFPNKEELIDALFEDRIAGIAAFAREALEDPDPWHGFVTFMEQACRQHTADRGLQQVVFSSAHGQDRVAHAREQIAPLVGRMLERAQAEGGLRADLAPTDVPMLQFMVASAAIYAGDVGPDVWRRMFTIVVDGLRARRDAPTALPIGPLTHEQFEQAMSTARF